MDISEKKIELFTLFSYHARPHKYMIFFCFGNNWNIENHQARRSKKFLSPYWSQMMKRADNKGDSKHKQLRTSLYSLGVILCSLWPLSAAGEDVTVCTTCALCLSPSVTSTDWVLRDFGSRRLWERQTWGTIFLTPILPVIIQTMIDSWSDV